MSNTFENFHQNEQNRFAVLATIAATESPGAVYNPIWIVGRDGSGKSHLLQAAENLSKSINIDCHVKYFDFAEKSFIDLEAVESYDIVLMDNVDGAFMHERS